MSDLHIVRRPHIRLCWFVHVNPDARDTQLNQRSVLLAPPRPDFRLRKVSPHTSSGPHPTLERLTTLVAHEESALRSLSIHLIVFVNLDARIDDRDNPIALLIERTNHPGRVGKAVGVPGEIAKSTHVVNVKIERVAWDALLTKSS